LTGTARTGLAIAVRARAVAIADAAIVAGHTVEVVAHVARVATARCPVGSALGREAGASVTLRSSTAQFKATSQHSPAPEALDAQRLFVSREAIVLPSRTRAHISFLIHWPQADSPSEAALSPRWRSEQK
jgi:hypothetical protein